MTGGDGEQIREVARAKLNVRLRVLGREEGGYHALETVFLRLGLADEVEVRAAEEGIELAVEHAPPADVPAAAAGRPGQDEAGGQGSLFDDAEGEEGRDGRDGRDARGAPGRRDGSDRDGGEAAGSDASRVPEGPGNLCWRAATLFHDVLGREPSVSLRLVKRVPAGAGLGGGSADAAAVLRGLSRLHGGPLLRGELLAMAGELGSDVPFALADVPAALGWERGRRLLPLEAPEPRPLLLVVPEVRISTPDAYGWLDEAREEPDRGAAGREDRGGRGGPTGDGPSERGRLPGAAVALPSPGSLARWDGLLSVAGNDFEEAVFARHPQLGWWKEELLGEGAEAALLCGSGSAVCGIFSGARRRDAAADRLREGGEVRVIPTRGPV